MNPVLYHLLILWAIVAGVLAVIFVVRRGGIKLEGMSNVGIFEFVFVALGIVIGLTTFFASEHYADMREADTREATSIGNISALSGSFPPRDGALLREQLFCYATEVIDKEWSRADGEGAPSVEGRQRAGYLILLRVGRGNPDPDVWYSNAMRSSLRGGEQRQDRLVLAEPQIPTLLWILIYVGAAMMVLFAFFFHLQSRAQLVGMLVVVVVMLSAVVAVLAGLDSPTEGPFGLEPSAMEAERELIGDDVDTGGKSPSDYCAALPYPSAESLLR